MLIQQIIFKYTPFKLFFSFRFQYKEAFFQRKSACNYTHTLTNCIQKASENMLEYQSASIPQFAKDSNKYVNYTQLFKIISLNFLNYYHCPSGEE